MKKYILDTSALITDPAIFKSLDKDSEVILPIAVLEELDKLKKAQGEVGKNARVCIRLLDELSNQGDITSGIEVNGLTVKIDSNSYPNTFGDKLYGDTRILSCANAIFLAGDAEVIFVSNDINLRVRAKAVGMVAVGHEKTSGTSDELYSGMKTVVDPEAGIDLLNQKTIDPRSYNLELHPNEFVVFTDEDENIVSMGRLNEDGVVKVVGKNFPWGLSARNKEQRAAIDLILDPSVALVTLVGSAGTGKSLIALASAIELVIDREQYEKLVIYKPMESVGQEIGFLPGPQPLDAKIVTPDGWTTMGSLKTGDLVISRDGKPTQVTGIFPKGTKSVYKVTTTDGTSTECCEDHLWYTQTFENKKRNKPGSVKSTKEIMESLKNKDGKINHYLPRNEAVHYSKKDVAIPPYVLGAILGDGSISDYINISNTDLELIGRVSKEVEQLNCSLTNSGKNIAYSFRSKLYNNKTARPVKVTNLIDNSSVIYNSIGLASKAFPSINRKSLNFYCNEGPSINNLKFEFMPLKNRWQNPIKEELYKLGLSGTKAWTKFIPDDYKYNSIENRIALLQGLMDTDGTIKKRGEATYCTTSKRLAEDIIELVRSLGGRATISERNRIGEESIINGRPIIKRKISYEFTVSLPAHINPFFISRKASRHSCAFMHRVAIKNIEYVGEKEVQCIRVDNPEHLYLTDNFIVTHNTESEKLSPWFQSIMDSFEFLFTMSNGDKWRNNFEAVQRKDRIQMNAITFIRGRNIPDSIILIDEIQNLTREEVKTILTRAGEGTKIICTGDIEQIDNKHLDAMNNGLTYIIDKFKDSELAGHVTLTQGERSALATEAARIL
jgi:predicted ribonuclease YlaK